MTAEEKSLLHLDDSKEFNVWMYANKANYVFILFLF